jgi:hypothetical protein
MHEYERQWSRGGGHAVRHPLRLKMERLAAWCGETDTPEAFEHRLEQALHDDDVGQALLAEELLPLWRAAKASRSLPFASPG